METQTTTPQTPADRAGTVGHETKQAAGDIASTAGQEAKQVTREAKDQVQALWSQTRRDLTEQAATQQTRVAGSLRELADQLGSMAGAADQDGMAVGLVDDVARRAGEAATWLDQRDPGSLLEEARESDDATGAAGSTGAGQFGDTNGSATGGNGYGTATGGYGTGSHG